MSVPDLVFSTPEYAALRDWICAHIEAPAGRVERHNFPDGERYQRVIDDVAGLDVAIVAGTINDKATLTLFDLACCLVKSGARSLTLVVPYYGYSTMERASHPGEVVTAKSRARLLSAIPPAKNGNRVLLLDLHSEGLPHYFEGEITALHVFAHDVVCDLARRFGGESFVLGSTDAGRAKWVAMLANRMGMEAAFVYKRRLDGSTTEVTAVNAAVEGRRVVIYDDMIRTGGSLIGAAQAYRDAGATAIFAVCTHGIFPGNALERIVDSGLFDGIACTDSHPRAVTLAGPDLLVSSVAGALAEALIA